MPSVGAGSSLVAAAVVAVIAFTGVVAFRGWPRTQALADGRPATLAPARLVDDGRSAARPARLAAAGTAGVASPAGRRASRPRATAPRSAAGPAPAALAPVATRGRATTPSAPAARAPAPVQPVASTPAPSAPPAASAPASRPASNPPAPSVPSVPVPSVPSVPVPAVPQRTVGTLVDTVQRVVPPAPAPLQPAVSAVNQTLDHTAATVDGVVDGATKAVGGLLGH